MATRKVSTVVEKPPQINDMIQYQTRLKDQFQPSEREQMLKEKIFAWEKESKAKIDVAVKSAVNNLQTIVSQSTERFRKSMAGATSYLNLMEKTNRASPDQLSGVEMHLQKCYEEYKALYELDIKGSSTPAIELVPVSPLTGERPDNESHSSSRSSWSQLATAEKVMSFMTTPREHQDLLASSELRDASTYFELPYAQFAFPTHLSPQAPISKFFEGLKRLPPMNKFGSLSGRCEAESRQMEQFLTDVFGFQNVRGEDIISGIRSFKLNKPIDKWESNDIIYFPTKSQPTFKMKVSEILEWQKSYRVYSYQDVSGLNESFLSRALAGKSQNGKEAFMMKFVVRVSTCPILMKFDGVVIPRETHETWPHLIKLISVTGIDFAGRKHDADDITTYIKNYDEIFETDTKTRAFIARNGRDFLLKPRAPPAVLKEDLLFRDLQRMAKLRLKVYDLQQIEIVIETGIGLGVFSGKQIGIDRKVRELSAKALRTVLEHDGTTFQCIRAIIFALPVFATPAAPQIPVEDTFHIFVQEFQNGYNGRIPVLIADQDMHQLAVEIARMGVRVSELNPADSYGIFGALWQGQSPALEEKLALTTLGLVVQHHLINRSVLETRNYRLL